MNIIINRTESSGYKSYGKLICMALEIAKKYNLSFCSDDVVYTQKEFLKKIKDKKNCVIIFDEVNL